MTTGAASPSIKPSTPTSQCQLQYDEYSLNFVSLSSAEGVSLLLARELDQPDDHGEESSGLSEQRSRSEKYFCTAQGVVFQDERLQRSKVQVEDLIKLVADPSTSPSNALLAKKALRYRKVLERRRSMILESGSSTTS